MNLDDRAEVRIFDQMDADINYYVEKYPEIWNSKSAFIRAAVQHFIGCPYNGAQRLANKKDMRETRETEAEE